MASGPSGFVKAGSVVANATAPMVESGDSTTWPFVDFVFTTPVALAVNTRYLLLVRLKSLGAVQIGLVANQDGTFAVYMTDAHNDKRRCLAMRG